MPGTNLAHAPTSNASSAPRNCAAGATNQRDRYKNSAMGLRACYDMSGTDLACSPLLAYALATTCPVVT
eukprot:2076034-Rhodomonas_salina.2